MALLSARGGLGSALDDDEAAQHGAVLARHLLPGGLAHVAPKGNLPAVLARRQEYAPAVVGHLHVVELGPALGIDRYGGAQIDQGLLEAVGPHGLPPVDVAGMPALQRAQHPAVLGEADIVGDLPGAIDVDDVSDGCLLWSSHDSQF